MQVSFHIRRSLFTNTGLISHMQGSSDMSYHMNEIWYIVHEGLCVRSLWTYAGLFSHKCRSLFAYAGLFLHMQGSSDMSYHMNEIWHIVHEGLCGRSLLIYTELFWPAFGTGLFPHMQVSFLIRRSFFAYTGLFSHLQVSFEISRALLTCIWWYSSRIQTCLFWHIQVSFIYAGLF